MVALELLDHLLSFTAPAVALGLAVALAGRFLFPRGGRWWMHAAANSAAGVAVLVLALWHFGVDGKMAAYAGLAAAVAASQWVCSRGWKG